MVLIGGSGSTGSSLLQNILNRHSDIFAGPETRLFIYPHLFSKWLQYRKHLLYGGLRGVRSSGWSMRGGAELLQEAFGWEVTELEKKLVAAPSFEAFVSTFFQNPLLANKAKIWIEKTPQNACSFAAFLTHFPKGRVIQTIRNPYDTVASLLARGFNAYEAAGYYIYHAAAATSLQNHERYFEVRYEVLVAQPQQAIETLLSFLGLPFLSEILNPTGQELANPLKLKGWNHSERGHIKKSSVGRFQQLETAEKEEVIAALQTFRVSKGHQERFHFKYVNCKDLCKQLGYDFLQTDTQPFLSKLKRQRRQDIWKRTIRLHPTHFGFYPGTIQT